MDEWSGCSCLVCKVEQTLIEEIAEKRTQQQYREVARGSPILSGFPTTLALLRRVRATTMDDDPVDSCDEILGELARAGAKRGQELWHRLVLLKLMPAVHRTSRQIAHGFPSLARDDIAQQVLTSIVEILQSQAPLEQPSHLAFTIARLMRRHSFRWAIREARLAATQELLAPFTAEALLEPATGFETTIHLQEFLQGCVYQRQLTETEYDLLMLFKIEGVSAEVLAAREGLSEVAFRHRMQRVVEKLRRIAKSPSLSVKRPAASRTTTALSRPAGRGRSAA